MARLRIDIGNLLARPLPPICIVCGCPSTTTVAKQFGSWASSRMVVRMRGKAAVPVCARHRNHWRWMTLLFTLVMLSGFGVLGVVSMLGVVLMPKDPPDMRVLFGLGGLCVGFVCFALWIGVGAVYLRMKHVTAAGFDGNCVILDNVSQEFAEACVKRGL